MDAILFEGHPPHQRTACLEPRWREVLIAFEDIPIANHDFERVVPVARWQLAPFKPSRRSGPGAGDPVAAPIRGSQDLAGEFSDLLWPECSVILGPGE